MELTLKVLGGKNAGKEIAVNLAEFLIGRGDHCHLRPHSGLISRQHCALLSREGTVAVRDLGSQNGTFVNGERIEGERLLKTGDRLTVGQLEFEVEFDSQVGAKRRPKVADVRDVATRTAKMERPGDSNIIAAWLSAEVQPSETAHETQVIDDSDTNEIFLAGSPPQETAATGATKVPANDVQSTPPPPHVRKPAAGKKGTGKLPPRPAAPAPLDSREAAAETLKKLLKGR